MIGVSMEGFPVLEGDRVRVRPLRGGDQADLLALRGDPRTAVYQSWTRFEAADAAKMIDEAGRSPLDAPGCWSQGGFATIDDDRLIGDCAFHCPAEDIAQAEIGFNLTAGLRGRGYASEAVGLLVDWLFSARGKRRIFAVTDRRNEPSRRLLRRLGFCAVPAAYRLVYFKGEWEGEAVYERTAAPHAAGVSG
ncbi:MAG: GNAT family N-acetyltransferase [Acidobacteria bacterium]|nr:GNAT family N-acetyltransferase [Acidobacteriota bacterium]